MKMLVVVATCAAGLVCGRLLAAAPDPWTRVPALPTACYDGQDHWLATNDAALVAVQQDHYRQDEVNAAIRQRFINAQEANPMALMQAMQQRMMSDPANAQRYMEQMTQQGQQAQADAPAQRAKEQQFEAESKTIMQQYNAALVQAKGPAIARWNALKKKRGYGPEVNWPGESGEPAWVWTEWNEIIRMIDTAYVAHCAQWWTANSPIHKHLKRYKDYLVLERTPLYRRRIDEPALDQYRLLNISTAGYRTTTDYVTAELYLAKARTMFNERWVEPRCNPRGCSGM